TTATGAITAAMTINGNLTVSAGLLFDNGLVITGNSTGTFWVADGATYQTSRNTTPPLLPTFDGANVALADSSIILYSGSAHSIPNNPTTVGAMTDYGVLAISGNVQK